MKAGADMDAPKRVGGRTCSVGGCEKAHTAVGYCSTHSSRYYAGRPLNAPVKPYKVPIGSKHDDGQGYIVVKVFDSKDGWVKEHRYVMEQYLGRPLTSTETVHHKNGDRTDNRLENLELWSTSHLPGQRVSDRLEWAKAFIARYENTQLELVP